MNNSSFFNLGSKLASVALNRDPSSLTTIASMVSTIDNSKEANYGFIQKFACKMAADAFDETGRKNEIEYHIFNKLANAPVWYPEFDNYSDAALYAFGKIAMEYEQNVKQAKTSAITKEAQNMIPGILAMAGRSTPDILKNLAAAGAVGGGITGGLYWLLNRHSQEDEDEAEAIKAKIDYYNKISDEIKNQLGTAKIPPAALAAKVQDIVKNDNLF